MLKYKPTQIKEALDTYDKIKSFRKVEFKLGISKSSIHRWWIKFHTLSIRQRFQKYKKTKSKRLSKYRELHSLTKNLFLDLDTVKYFTLSQIQHILEKTYHKKPSLQWISQSLKKNKISKRKFRRNRVCTRSETELLQMTKNFYNELRSIDIGKIISIDETSFCNIGVSEEGYFLKGKHPSSLQVKKRITMSLLMAISKNNIISSSLQNKAFNSSSFFDFIKGILDKIPNNDKHVLIMDNVPFHKSKKIRDLVNSKGHQIIYIPPYSPQCNPIEEVFSELKRKYRSCDERCFIDKIKTSIVKIDNSNFERYFYHTMKFIQNKINTKKKN
jgi:transposase